MQLQRQVSFLIGKRRAFFFFFKTPKKCRFPVNCICTHATGSRPPDHEWTVCVRSCTRCEGCLAIIEIVSDCSDECSFSVKCLFSLGSGARFFFFKTPKNVDFLSNCICTHATGSRPPDHEWTVCVRSCTRCEGCLAIIDIVSDCSDECSFSVKYLFSLGNGARFFFFFRNTKKMSISCQLHLHPCHWLPTSR